MYPEYANTPMTEVTEAEVTYRELENGSREPSWDQYMTLLFLYHYNMRTTDIVKNLGLYPDSLREKISIGED